MDINKILKSDYLDILFEGRNKQYGGYELRRKYQKRMIIGTSICIGLVLLLAVGDIVAKMANKGEVKKTIVMNTPVVLTEPPPIDPKKPPPPPPPSEPPPPVKPTVKFTPPVIKKDEEVKEDEKPPKQEELKPVASGATTAKGDVNGIDPGIVDKPGTGTGVVDAPKPPEIFKYVEQMPTAGYDMNAYLDKNLHYPEAARENNIQGRVTVKFVVNEDGHISGVEVVRGIGGGCDEEAKRVVSAMPPWKPGKSNGQAVKVYFNLPIAFKLE